MDGRQDEADILHDMACAARAAGRPDLAIGLAGKAIALLPAAHFHITLGCALREQGHGEEARAALAVAILREPRDARAHAALAGVLGDLERWAEAEASLRAARALRPGDVALLLDWAHARTHAGGPDVGSDIVARADALTPDHAGPLHGLAILLSNRGQPGQAEALYRLIVRLRPDDGAAWANHGAVLFALNRHEEARAVLDHAVALAPGNAETWNNLGLVLMALGHLPQARNALERARALAPGDIRIAVNAATILTELAENAAAEALNRAVLADPSTARGPDGARADFNLGTLLLARGLRAEGWRHLEARSRLLPPGRHQDMPEWDGSALASGRVLLQAEQGLGDTIQFLRYLPECLRRVPVVLDVPKSLHRLLRRVPDADAPSAARCTILPPGAPVPDDVVARCGLPSLPHRLGMADIPAFTPYLRPTAWPVVERPGGGFPRVGLCWAGSPSFRFDRRRSIPAHRLAPLADVTGLSFVCLQHGRASDPSPFALERSPDGDMLATARTIAGLDLVITVDTAVAHLAGAMGRPVWLLNRFGGDWRWSAAFDRGTPPRWGDRGSLWYPSLEQFRQHRPDDPDTAWTGPIAAVRAALLRWRAFARHQPD
jgi:Flp pilus assembly protein TadD